MIKIGALLDACGIPYTEKQLAKLEELVTKLINTQLYQTIQTLSFDKELQDGPRDLSISNETSSVNSETKVIAENISTFKREVSETVASDHCYAEISQTLNDFVVPEETLDIKDEVDEFTPTVKKSPVSNVSFHPEIVNSEEQNSK